MSSCEDEAQQSEEISRPNVILILTDDQGWGDLSINGNTNLQTPHIDQIGRQGAIFDRFYVSPVCSPTRAELLTGRYAVRGGIYSTSEGGERLDLDEVTVADIFKENGYRTAAFGKWHNGMQYPYHPNGRGFEEFYGFCSGHWGSYFDPMLEHNGQIVQGEGFLVDDLTSHALGFIEEHQEDPFFVYLPYNTPHSPMQVPESYWHAFENKELGLHYDGEKEDLLHTKAALALCENIDHNVGRIMDKLDVLNLAENTILIYLSDNGPNGWRWNGGMKGKKGSTDEGGVRSPLMMRWPGKIEPGLMVDKISSALDLLPTLTAMASIEYESVKELDGRSLTPLLMGEDGPWNERVRINHWRGNTSVRSQRFLLDDEDQLFDMLIDPGQESNIAEEAPGIVDFLTAEKETWIASVLAELPSEDTRSFPVGHPDFRYTQVPARDGIPHGNIERSNRFPNCTYFTNWISQDDSISWDVEVLKSGLYEVVLYYTCPVESVGSVISVKFGDAVISGTIENANDPPETGMEYDRSPRMESYVKDFKPMVVGKLELVEGTGELVLRCSQMVGPQVMDVRLMMINRVGS
ncbi:UNVERIFIED_CONTAM: hypothetical protein GTU68_008357 [Idotea baltica]|nr:hypothetical protein [Idotea baltica]